MPKAQYLGGMLSNMKLKVSGMKKPDAKPPKNCIVNKVGRFGEKGVNKEMSANAMDAPINTRRGPNVAPIQMAGTVMSIWAAVCAVVIQAPSSNPAPTAPRMSARPNVDNRPFRVDMNVPMSTATSPSQGMEVGGDGSVGAVKAELGRGSGAFIFARRLWRLPWLPPTCRAPADPQGQPRRQCLSSPPCPATPRVNFLC